jgi:hypothetical protein
MTLPHRDRTGNDQRRNGDSATERFDPHNFSSLKCVPFPPRQKKKAEPATFADEHSENVTSGRIDIRRSKYLSTFFLDNKNIFMKTQV